MQANKKSPRKTCDTALMTVDGHSCSSFRSTNTYCFKLLAAMIKWDQLATDIHFPCLRWSHRLECRHLLLLFKRTGLGFIIQTLNILLPKFFLLWCFGCSEICMYSYFQFFKWLFLIMWSSLFRDIPRRVQVNRVFYRNISCLLLLLVLFPSLVLKIFCLLSTTPYVAFWLRAEDAYSEIKYKLN